MSSRSLDTDDASGSQRSMACQPRDVPSSAIESDVNNRPDGLVVEVLGAVRRDDPELRLQVAGCLLCVRRATDRLDHLVEVVQADLQALEDVGPLLRLLEVESRPPEDDVAAMIEALESAGGAKLKPPQLGG